MQLFFLAPSSIVVTDTQLLFQQQQRPDLARLMQMHAAQTAQLGALGQAPIPGLPPGLLGHPGAVVGPAGLPASLLGAAAAGIPTSLAQAVSAAGTHPAFASLLAQQKPAVTSAATDHPLAAAAAAAAAAKSREEELKRAADTNGGKTFVKLHD